jgi:surface protein
MKGIDLIMKKRNEELINNKKGITLVALVVSIVVLIILAGVSVSMLTGTNGILRQASNAKEQTETANEKEKIQLAYIECKMKNSNNDVKAEELFKQLNNDNVNVTKVYGDDLIVVIINNNVYEIDKNENINFMGSLLSYSKEEPVMMAINTEYAFWKEEYKTNIIKIETKPYIVKLENIEYEWDVSENKDKSVMAYLMKLDEDKYELVLMANGKIKFNRNCYRLFGDFTSLESAKLLGVDTENVTTMYGLFMNCPKLTDLDISSFNTSNVTNMDRMFQGCSSLKSLDIQNFDTKNVTSMSSMFREMTSIEELNLRNFDTSNVTSMWYMFQADENLKELYIENFYMEKVIDMYNMFGDRGYSSLSDEGLNNVLLKCSEALNISEKTLKYIGLNDSKASYCTTLNNYEIFAKSGWTTGY